MCLFLDGIITYVLVKDFSNSMITCASFDVELLLSRQYMLAGVEILRVVIQAYYSSFEFARRQRIRISIGRLNLCWPPLHSVTNMRLFGTLSELLYALLLGVARHSLSSNSSNESLSITHGFASMLHQILQLLLRAAKEVKPGDGPVNMHLSFSASTFNTSEGWRTGFVFTIIKEALTLLDTELRSHKLIFEEFLDVLHLYIGQRLHYLVFGHVDFTDIENQILNSSNGSPLRFKQSYASAYGFDSMLLVRVLEILVGIAQNHAKLLIDGSDTFEISSKCFLQEAERNLIVSKLHLQKRLVGLMFGYSTDPTPPDFDKILTNPMRYFDSRMVAKVGIVEQFKYSVWELVGWDILRDMNTLTCTV